jgi:hypothetical protein
MPRFARTLPVFVSFLLIALPGGAEVIPTPPTEEELLQKINDFARDNDIPGGAVTQDQLEEFLLTEAYVESMRLEKSNVTVLKRNKQLDFDPTIHSEISNGMAEWAEVRKIQVPGSPNAIYELRPISPEELMQRRLEAVGQSKDALADAMDGMAMGMTALGVALAAGIQESGFGSILGPEVELLGEDDGFDSDCEDLVERGLGKEHEQFIVSGIGSYGRYTGFMPISWMLLHACMLRWSAMQLDDIEIPTVEQYAAEYRRQLDEFKKRARITGTEVIDGQQTLKVAVTGIGIKEKTEDGRTIEIEEVGIWIDPQHYKRPKIRLEGTVTEGRKSQEFFMERESQDYRRVEGTYLYEPYAEVVRVGGVMTDKERRELAKAQKELEKAEAELAAMPASQRAMVEKMMGSQMAQMRNMVNTGMFETRIVTTSIEINPDFATAFGPMTIIGAGPDGSSGGGASGGTNAIGQGDNASVIRLIQAHLTTLGYEPGPATGQLDAMTTIAISQYQAEKGLPVTGEPSAALAQRLQTDVDAR